MQVLRICQEQNSVVLLFWVERFAGSASIYANVVNLSQRRLVLAYMDISSWDLSGTKIPRACEAQHKPRFCWASFFSPTFYEGQEVNTQPLIYKNLLCSFFKP
ncbi:hypothetical protein C2869_02125 [Saccharobesus litoralis]|uniref:Uncharacterized protein n=1 Tax=Saccharobesus litoralis TaxID=2172099 RepID=A0A2S0VM80_9ALTE|nr:hypothetical protein C2869_02125 [Saccharobesus litoralis]